MFGRRASRLAPRAHRPCLLVHPVIAHAARAAWRCAPFSGALKMTERRALRGYRGRTETPPAKLSACATCHAYGTLPTRGAHGGAMGTSRPTAITPAYFRTRNRPRWLTAPGGAMVGRRASRLAPYRHYTRNIRTRALPRAHRHYARPRGTAHYPPCPMVVSQRPIRARQSWSHHQTFRLVETKLSGRGAGSTLE